uniref:Dipeptidylpeptidase IV N-terminal domain-containing protein n=1 Tax=Strongyloides stercoralis TaxID=6248 RepID=A0A0K0EEC0_STRER
MKNFLFFILFLPFIFAIYLNDCFWDPIPNYDIYKRIRIIFDNAPIKGGQKQHRDLALLVENKKEYFGWTGDTSKNIENIYAEFNIDGKYALRHTGFRIFTDKFQDSSFEWIKCNETERKNLVYYRNTIAIMLYDSISDSSYYGYLKNNTIYALNYQKEPITESIHLTLHILFCLSKTI